MKSLADLAATVLNQDHPEPDPADLLRLYLELPVTAPRRGQQVRFRSSFEASFTDAEAASDAGRSWIGAIGHLCYLDQLGSALRLKGQTPIGPSAVELALEQFSSLDGPERAALYALRCCLAHDYSLANPRGPSDPRQQLLQHRFELFIRCKLEEVVALPAAPWDGKSLDRSAHTSVDLGQLQRLARLVRQRVLNAHAGDDLELNGDPVAFRAKFFFTHDPELLA